MQSEKEVTDHQLIAMCQAGKDLGFTALYNKYAKAVYNSITRIVSHTGEAEDILQDTFYTVFNDIGKMSGVLSFEAWVRRIAINRSISHLRKKKIVFADVEPDDYAVDNAYSLEEDHIFNCKVEDVRSCLENLSTGYKTILNLYLFENMQHDEIAELLGLSPNTVRSQYHRGKKKIFLQLKDKSYEN